MLIVVSLLCLWSSRHNVLKGRTAMVLWLTVTESVFSGAWANVSRLAVGDMLTSLLPTGEDIFETCVWPSVMTLTGCPLMFEDSGNVVRPSVLDEVVTTIGVASIADGGCRTQLTCFGWSNSTIDAVGSWAGYV